LTLLGSATLPVIPRSHPPEDHNELEEAPLFVLITTYLGYLVLIVFGHVRDFFGKRFKWWQYSHLKEAHVSLTLALNFSLSQLLLSLGLRSIVL
jgi:glycopeptide antibiotics resistance protein